MNLELRAILCPQTPSHIYCCKFVTLAIVSGGIWFSIIFSIGISAAIRNAEHLVWWGRFGFVFSFFFFLKECKDNLALGIGFLKVGCVWNLFLQRLPQDVPWQRLSFTEPQALWTEVPVSKNDQVVVSGNVHKAAALFRLSLVPEGNQSLWASLLSGLWDGVECAWANSKGLSFTTFSP